ncbi:MAG: hypothetical protein AAF721_27580 [Myxococcota bacterium]
MLVTSLAYAGPRKPTKSQRTTQHHPTARPTKNTKSSPPAPEARSVSGTLANISTRITGEVATVGLMEDPNSRDIRFHRGCGMRLANVPHLAAALQTRSKVSLRVVGECISSVTVHEPPSSN